MQQNVLINFIVEHFNYHPLQNHVLIIEDMDGEENVTYFSVDDSTPNVIGISDGQQFYYINESHALMQAGPVVREFEHTETVREYICDNFDEEDAAYLLEELSACRSWRMYHFSLELTSGDRIDQRELAKRTKNAINHKIKQHEDSIKKLKKGYGFVKSLKAYL